MSLESGSYKTLLSKKPTEKEISGVRGNNQDPSLAIAVMVEIALLWQ